MVKCDILEKVDSVDLFRPDSILNLPGLFFGMSAMGRLLVDQVNAVCPRTVVPFYIETYYFNRAKTSVYMLSYCIKLVKTYLTCSILINFCDEIPKMLLPPLELRKHPGSFAETSLRLQDQPQIFLKE